MRKLILAIAFILCGITSFAQTSYLWLTKSDTTGKAFRGILDFQGSGAAGSTFLTKERCKDFNPLVLEFTISAPSVPLEFQW